MNHAAEWLILFDYSDYALDAPKIRWIFEIPHLPASKH
jgi:hypothetical protein